MSSIMECVERIDNERIKCIVSMRLQGKLLEDISKALGITRERVRQVFRREMLKIRRSKVREDEYRYIFENYYFSKDVFTSIFNEPESSYYYLRNVYTCGAKNLKHVFTDDNVPDEWKELIQNTVKITPAYVFIDGEKVRKNKINLLTHCLKMSDVMTGKELWTKYNEFIRSHGLDDYVITTYHAFETIARRSYKIIFSSTQSLRYYDMPSKNYTKLFDGLNLLKYDNSEISTNLLFRENISLMKEYDFRNEYELHNVLRKLHQSGHMPSDKVPSRIHFSRMPMIGFGKFSRYEQIEKIILDNGYKTMKETTEEYERKYGMTTNVLSAQFPKELRRYFGESSDD